VETKKMDPPVGGVPTFRIMDNFQDHYIDYIVEEFVNQGLVQVEAKAEEWNVSWCIYYPPQKFQVMKNWQKVNNLPEIKHLVGKDFLNKLMDRVINKYGREDFSFWPMTFNLDIHDQYHAFRSMYLDFESRNEAPPIYIIKRPGLARGEGVHLISNVADIDEMLTNKSACYPIGKTKPIAQEFVTDVLLLEGYKITLRVYAVISSVDPLRVYIFPNGLVRMCSKKYNTEINSLKDQFVHIDSIDINYVNEEIFEEDIKNSDLVHDGLRCEITYLLKRLEEKQGVNGTKLWADIKNLVVTSVASAEHYMYPEFKKLLVENRSRRAGSWEMVGYDILIDNNMKPWLLEINNSPSMSPHTNLENVIKKSMLHDLFDLVDVSNKNYENVGKVVRRKWNIIQKFPPKYLLKSHENKFFNVSSIATKEDMWVIVETELENSRKGNFERGFPEVGTRYYTKFLANPHNKLILDWLEAGMTLADLDTNLEELKKNNNDRTEL